MRSWRRGFAAYIGVDERLQRPPQTYLTGQTHPMIPSRFTAARALALGMLLFHDSFAAEPQTTIVTRGKLLLE